MMVSTPRRLSYEMTSTDAQDELDIEYAADIPLMEEIVCDTCKKTRRQEIVIRTLIVTNAGIFLLAVMLVFSILRAFEGSHSDDQASGEFNSTLPDSVYSPARAIEGFQAVRFDGAVNTTNPWKGPPSENLDAAWSELFEVGPMAITRAALQKIGKTSMEIPTEPGHHLAKLAVFHQLHCLDKVRRYVHNDHYKMDDSHSSVSTVDHIDHCIDILRQTVMCKADTTLITFQREEIFGTTNPDFEATHACADFDAVHAWAKPREINMTRELNENPEEFERHLIKSIEEMLQDDPRDGVHETKF